MERIARVLLQDGIIRIVTHATTTSGLTIGHIPVFILKETDNPEEIGLKALEALHGFQEKSVPHPKNQEEWKTNDIEWCKNLQINSSWRTFLLNGAKDIKLKMDGDIIKITPTKNCIHTKTGENYDFKPLEDKSRICSTAPSKLGRAILSAFDDCE